MCIVHTGDGITLVCGYGRYISKRVLVLFVSRFPFPHPSDFVAGNVSSRVW